MKVRQILIAITVVAVLGVVGGEETKNREEMSKQDREARAALLTRNELDAKEARQVAAAEYLRGNP